MDLDAILNKGIEYCGQKDYEKALECLNQIINYDPNYAKAYHYRGLVRRRQRDDRGSIEDLERAATLLAEREYAAMSQKMRESIGENYRAKRLEYFEKCLSKRLERSYLIQEKRAKNGIFDEKKLRDNNLPLCNSHE